MQNFFRIFLTFLLGLTCTMTVGFRSESDAVETIKIIQKAIEGNDAKTFHAHVLQEYWQDVSKIKDFTLGYSAEEMQKKTTQLITAGDFANVIRKEAQKSVLPFTFELLEKMQVHAVQKDIATAVVMLQNDQEVALGLVKIGKTWCVVSTAGNATAAKQKAIVVHESVAAYHELLEQRIKNVTAYETEILKSLKIFKDAVERKDAEKIAASIILYENFYNEITSSLRYFRSAFDEILSGQQDENFDKIDHYLKSKKFMDTTTRILKAYHKRNLKEYNAQLKKIKKLISNENDEGWMKFADRELRITDENLKTFLSAAWGEVVWQEGDFLHLRLTFPVKETSNKVAVQKLYAHWLQEPVNSEKYIMFNYLLHKKNNIWHPIISVPSFTANALRLLKIDAAVEKEFRVVLDMYNQEKFLPK